MDARNTVIQLYHRGFLLKLGGMVLFGPCRSFITLNTFGWSLVKIMDFAEEYNQAAMAYRRPDTANQFLLTTALVKCSACNEFYTGARIVSK